MLKLLRKFIRVSDNGRLCSDFWYTTRHPHLISSVHFSTPAAKPKPLQKLNQILTPAEKSVVYPEDDVTTKRQDISIPNVEYVMKVDESLQSPDYFQVYNLFTVRDLFEARVHLEHKIGSMDPNMKNFIFGNRFDSLIFDLDKTAYHLRQALNFIAHIAFRKGIILFVSRSPQTMHLIEKTAVESGEYAHCRGWESATLTNSERKFGGITRLPDLIIMLNTLDTIMAQHSAVTDASKMLIPTVGIVDSNCNPNLITYSIPGNDDTLCSVELYCKLFKEAILRGKNKRKLLESHAVEAKK